MNHYRSHAAEAGADVIMTQPVTWGACTPAGLAEHYDAVARELPVMIVTNVFAQRGMDLGLPTVELALQRGNVVAIKDDLCGEFARRLCLLAHERCAIFAGGFKENHLNMWPYGCGGYMSNFLEFKPEIAWRYWKAVEAGNLEEIRLVLNKYELPYVDLIRSFEGGVDSGIHGTLELFGLAQRFRRKPYYSLTDQDMAKLRAFFTDRGLL